MKEYEAYVGGAAGSGSPAAGGADDGERAAENAYIAFVAGSGRLEALYYALTRKRARLFRGGHTAAAARMEEVWGEWLTEVNARAAAAAAAASGGAIPDATHAALGGRKGAAATAVTEADVAALTNALFGGMAPPAAAGVKRGHLDERNLAAARAVSEAVEGAPAPPKLK
mgnify:CR=1 FL=1